MHFPAAASVAPPSRLPILLLALCQAMLLTNNIVNIGMNGIVGFTLAENKALATLPLTAYVVGTAIATYPASMWMSRVGRRYGFVTGSAFGIAGVSISALSVVTNSFWLLTLGTFVTGGYNAFGQYYRFAAAEAVEESWRGKAIGLVLGGGILGAIVGPEGARLAKDMFAIPFIGAYALLAVCMIASMALQLNLRIPAPKIMVGDVGAAIRPLREIAAHPRFVVAVLGAVAGYAVMSFLMTSTPLAMIACGHAYADSSFVIEWHAVAMFAPSFVTGALIRRFGGLAILGAGAAAMIGTAAVGLAGTTVTHFWVALVLLGLGWNFLYVGGTAILTTTYRPSERAKVQGINDVLVFSATGFASLMSGVMLNAVGWNGIVIAMLAPVLAILGVLLWAARAREPAPEAHRA